MTGAPARERRADRAWLKETGAAESLDTGRHRGDAMAEQPQGPPAGDPHAPLPRAGDAAAQPAPPDGGWGWVVVFASFMIHIVTDGVTYSFGMFYAEFLNYFGSGAGETALIASLLVGVTLCSGPVSSAFVNRYGCRAVTIAGAILGAASMSLSVFAPNVFMLYLTIGIGTGLGFGLIYLPAIVSVTCYFEKYRSLATGIAVCGSGLGTFIFAPVTEALILQLEWQYALLVIALLVLSCVTFGMLFRPLKEPEEETALEMESPIAAKIQEEGAATGAPIVPTAPVDEKGPTLPTPPPGEAEALSDKSTATRGLDYRLAGDELPLSLSEGAANPKNPKAVAPPFERPRSACLLPGISGGGARGASSHGRGPFASKGPAARLALSQPALLTISALRAGSSEDRLGELQSSAPRRHASGIMYRRDILYFGSLQHIHHHHRSTNALHESVHLLHDGDMTVSHQEDGLPSQTDTTPGRKMASQHSLSSSVFKSGAPLQDHQQKCCGLFSPEASDAFSEMMNCSLLRDPIFIIFTISNFLTSIGFNIPYVYLPVQAEGRNVDKNRLSWLLSAMGIANTVGRIILGYISDKKWVNRLLVYNVCLTICGIATAFSGLCESFECFIFYSVTYGFFIGAYVGLTSVVLVDLMGLERLTNAFGLLLLFQGIASLVGPPIAGWLKDALDSYDPGFIVAGVTMAISGVMLFIIPSVQRALDRRHQSYHTNTDIEMNGTVQPLLS